MRGQLADMPVFMREKAGSANDTPRMWFNDEEYTKLKAALRKNIATHRENATRWQQDAEEMRDYVLFVANTGLRIGEAMNLRLCDVTIASERDPSTNERTEHLEIRQIKGKTGNFGQCKSEPGCVPVFKNCIARHGLTLENYRSSQANIFKAYHRDAFRALLESEGLYQTQDRPPRKRDLMCLRHTYICFKGVPDFEIANNCRTSADMIRAHYARHLSVFKKKRVNREQYVLADVDMQYAAVNAATPAQRHSTSMPENA